MKKTTKSLIIAVSSVVVLVGAFLAVYYLVPEQEDDENSTGSALNSSVESEEEHYHLIGHSTAEIKEISVDNEGGEYTIFASPKEGESAESDTAGLNDENVYTLSGFEDMELMDGVPQTLAADAVSVTASRIVNDGSKKADFGFNSPRSVVTVTLNSGDKRTVTLGDDAPDNKGAYIMVDGDENVYLTDSESVDGFVITKMGMFSTDIGTSLSDTNEQEFTKLEFSGTAFNDEKIVFDYNYGDAFTETYFITSPDKLPANEDNATFVMSNIRYLAAEEVVAVDVDEDTLKEYGLDKPYMTVEAEYPDLKVRYKAAEPKEGMFYLLCDGVVYKMDQTAVPWISYTYDDLITDDVLAPKYDSVDKITVEADGKKYVFDIDRTSNTVRDDSNDTDIETFTIKVKCNNKELDENIYTAFYNNLTSAKRNGLEDVAEGKKTVLKVKFDFSDGTSAEAEYFEGKNRKCPVLINGTVGSAAYESYVTKILEDVKKAAKGEEIKSIN